MQNNVSRELKKISNDKKAMKKLEVLPPIKKAKNDKEKNSQNDTDKENNKEE